MDSTIVADNLDKLAAKESSLINNMFPSEAKDGETKLQRTDKERDESKRQITIRDAMSRMVDDVYWNEENTPTRNILTAWLMSHRDDFGTVYEKYGPQLLGEFLGLPRQTLSRFKNDTFKDIPGTRGSTFTSRIHNHLAELLSIEENSIQSQREYHNKVIQESTKRLEYLEGISNAITLVLEYAESKGVGTAPSRVYKNRSIPG